MEQPTEFKKTKAEKKRVTERTEAPEAKDEFLANMENEIFGRSVDFVVGSV